MFELPSLRPGIDPTLPADKKQLVDWLRQGEGREISATIRRVYDLSATTQALISRYRRPTEK